MNVAYFSRAKRIYIGGLLFYSCGMCMLALTKAQASVIIFSWCAGVMYSTLFTMPYLLVAHYHSEGCVSIGFIFLSLEVFVSFIKCIRNLKEFCF